MDTRIAFVADGETPIAMQPGERAFDDPAGRAEPAAMRRAPPREEGNDAAGPQTVAMGLRIVAAIPLQRARPARRPTGPTPDRRECRHERVELRNVVDVRGGQLRDERDPVGFRDEVVLGTRLAAIGWVRSSFFPPRNARRDALSTIAHRRSNRPQRRNSASRTSCKRCHTPARCQRTSRRQQVLPEPQPISFGNICQGSPARNTKRIPVSAARSGTRGRPAALPGRRRCLGSSGAIRAHRRSSISGWDMADRTKRSEPVQEPRQ